MCFWTGVICQHLRCKNVISESLLVFRVDATSGRVVQRVVQRDGGFRSKANSRDTHAARRTLRRRNARSRAGPNGDTWIAKWRDGGRQVQRGLGFVHCKRHPDGLTRAEAEVALGKLRERVAIERADERAADSKRAAEERRRPLAQVGEALITAKRAAGRKPSTMRPTPTGFGSTSSTTSARCPSARSAARTSVASRRRWSARASRQSPGRTHRTLHSLISSRSTRAGWSARTPSSASRSRRSPDRCRCPLPGDRGGGSAPACHAGRPVRAGRARDVPDHADDRNAPGRAVRAALA